MDLGLFILGDFMLASWCILRFVSFGLYRHPRPIGAPLVTLGLSPRVTSYSRTRSCENDTFRTILNSSFLVAELLEFDLDAKPFLEDLLRLNIDNLDPFELRHDLRLVSVLERRMGVLAADAVKVASSDKGSGTEVLVPVYCFCSRDLPVEMAARSKVSLFGTFLKTASKQYRGSGTGE